MSECDKQLKATWVEAESWKMLLRLVLPISGKILLNGGTQSVTIKKGLL